MSKSTCENKNIVFKTSEASTKAWFRTNKLIDNSLNVLDYGNFVVQNNKWSDVINKDYRLEGKLFTLEAGGTKVIPNTELFHKLDAIRGRFYPDNEYLRSQPIKTIPTISDIVFDVPTVNATELDRNKAMRLFNAFGTKFEKAFGIPYEIITRDEAYDKLSLTKTPYNNQAGFYYNNKVYFVREALSVETMLHEYSHPLVKAINIADSGLFEKLYKSLESLDYWPEIKAGLEKTGLTEEDPAYKEEALVRVITKDAVKKVEDQTYSDPKFDNLINKILYAIKQIFKKLTKVKSLNDLKTITNVQQLSDMLVEEDFHLENLYFDETDYADFSDQFVELSKELNNVDREKLEEAINRAYVEARFQITQLRNAPWKLKNDLTGKNGLRILNNLRDYLKNYQTAILDPNKITAEEVLDAVENQEKEFRKRAVALVNSLNEVKVFVSKIEDILIDMEDTNKYLTRDGIAKLNYFKEFIGRQKSFMDDLSKILSLKRTNPIAADIRVIKDVINASADKIKDLEKKVAIEFFTDKTEFMTNELEKRIADTANRLMKAEKIPQDRIDAFVDKIINSPNGTNITVNDLEIPLRAGSARTLVTEVNQYFVKRLNRDTITNYVEGKTEDIGFISSLFTPYMNIDDPIGSFARYVKTKLSEAETMSLKQANDIANKLVPILNKFGYNPNTTGQLGEALLTVDRVGSTNDKGEFEEYELYRFLSRYGNGWQADRDRLKYEFDKAREKGNKEEIETAIRNLWEFDAKYMTRKYKDAYYDKQKLWTQDNDVIHPKTKETLRVSKKLSTEAFLEKQKAQDTMNMYKNREKGEGEDLYAFTTADAAKAEYEALFNPYDDNGKLKTGDDLLKTLLRIKYRENTRGFYEYVADESRVQEDLAEFIKDLEIRGITEEQTPDDYKKEMALFIKKNFRVSYSETYFKDRKRIFDKLNELNNRTGKVSPVAQELADLYSQRFRLANQITDVNSLPFGDRYNSDQRELMKKLEERIVELQTKYDQNSGLTVEQLETLENYKQMILENRDLTPEQDYEYTNLVNIKNSSGLSPVEYQMQRDLLSELGEMTTREVTEYYIRSFTSVLGETTAEPVDVTDINKWINSNNLEIAMGQSPEFKKWFEQNHFQKTIYQKGKPKQIWLPTRLWTYSKPTDPSYYKVTTLTNPITGQPIRIQGVPSSKYSYQKVKKEFRTGYNPTTGKVDLRVGIEVDNRGNFLPNINATDRKYISKEYEDLAKSNSVRFELLNAVTEVFLDMQKGKPGSSKLYLDLPRFSMRADRSNLEYIQSGKGKEDLNSKLESVKDFITAFTGKKADDFETTPGFNANSEMQLVQTDLQGLPIARVPVRGLYKLKRSDVSQDVLRGMYTYLHSLNEQKILIQEEPLAKALMNVMNDPENAVKRVNVASKNIFESTGVYSFLPASDNRRAKALTYFIEKTFYGQAYSTFGEENPFTTKIANTLMHAASRSFIAMDMVSAFKNRFGMIMQNSIEAAAGTHYNVSSFAQGRIWSFNAVVQLMSKGIYSVGPKSLELQMMEYFDPIIGKTKADFGKSTSRTFLKDFFDGTWMYDPRKLMEVEGGLQVFAGMMYNQKVEQKQPDGSVKMIPYIEAFELDDNQQLKLKDGINPEWSPQRIEIEYKTGDDLSKIAAKYNMTVDELRAKNKIKNLDDLEEGDTIVISEAGRFSDYKLKIQGVGMKLNGMSDQYASPQGEKYLAYRLFMFYKKYATSMFLNRFQADMSKNNRWGHVYDWNLGTPTKGYYITAFQAFTKGLRDMGAYWGVMSTEEKSAMKKVLAEGAFLAVLAMATVLLFGYDPGDEDRFEKMKEREKNFGFYGYMGNHVLYQLMMVKRENESFIPLPMIGLDDWIRFGDTSTIVTGPTIGLYTKILTDMLYMLTGDEKAVYRGDAGPYPWQDEGSYKLWNHLLSIYGIKGKNYDPIAAIKSAEIFENLK
jgi:hypothetical protein